MDSYLAPLSIKLESIRSRVIRSTALLIATTLISYLFRVPILKMIKRPLQAEKLIFIHPTEAFFTYIKLSIFTGLVIIAPYVFLQLVQFIAQWKKQTFSWWFSLTFFVAAIIFFYGGISFAFYLVLPWALRFLQSVSGSQLEAMFTVGNYTSFVIIFVLTFGVTFEIPIFTVVLSRLGIINSKMLISKWRYVLAVTIVLAGILTPPDPLTQLMLWGPLVVLYGLAIVLTYCSELLQKP